MESTCGCVLGSWPWAFLSLALRGSVLEKVVLGLGLGFFCVLGLGLEPWSSTPPLSFIITRGWHLRCSNCNYFTCDSACAAIIFKQLRLRLRCKYFSNFERNRASASQIRLWMIVFQSSVIKVNKKTLTRYICVARIFDWRNRPNHKSHVMTTSKFFEKRDFLLDKDTVERRIRSRCLGWHVTWVLLNKKGLEPKLKRFPKLSKLGDMLSKLV